MKSCWPIMIHINKHAFTMNHNGKPSSWEIIDGFVMLKSEKWKQLYMCTLGLQTVLKVKRISLNLKTKYHKCGISQEQPEPNWYISFYPSPRVTEDSTATTLEALKARIRELEKQILRGDRYKCLICMVRTAHRINRPITIVKMLLIYIIPEYTGWSKASSFTFFFYI